MNNVQAPGWHGVGYKGADYGRAVQPNERDTYAQRGKRFNVSSVRQFMHGDSGVYLYAGEDYIHRDRRFGVFGEGVFILYV